jgi:hypothetical protein
MTHCRSSGNTHLLNHKACRSRVVDSYAFTALSSMLHNFLLEPWWPIWPCHTVSSSGRPRSIKPRRPLAGPRRALLQVAVRSLNNICMLLLTYATCRRNACIMADLLLKLYSTHTCCDYATCMRSAMSPLLCLLCVVWPASAPHPHRPSSWPSSRRLG